MTPQLRRVAPKWHGNRPLVRPNPIEERSIDEASFGVGDMSPEPRPKNCVACKLGSIIFPPRTRPSCGTHSVSRPQHQCCIGNLARICPTRAPVAEQEGRRGCGTGGASPGLWCLPTPSCGSRIADPLGRTSTRLKVVHARLIPRHFIDAYAPDEMAQTRFTVRGGRV